MTIRVVSKWQELHWGPGPSWQWEMRDRQGEGNLGEHWEIWVVRECAMNLGQSTGHEVWKLDRSWLSQGCFLRPSGQPHSVKACVFFFFSNIYLFFKSHLDRVRVGWMRGHDGNGAGTLCWLIPGTDGAPTGGAHRPTPTMEEGSPWPPCLWACFLLSAEVTELSRPIVYPQQCPPGGTHFPSLTCLRAIRGLSKWELMFSSAAWLPGDISWHGINRENSKMDPLGHGTSISSLGPLAMQQQQMWQVWLAFSTRESDKGGRSAQPQGNWGNQGRMVLIPQIIVLKWKWEVSDKRGWRAVRIQWEATSFLYIPLEKKQGLKALSEGKYLIKLWWSPGPTWSAPQKRGYTPFVEGNH